MAFKGNTLFETLDLLDELRRILRNPQYNLNYNAQEWLKRATDQSVPVETLATWINNNANSFERQANFVKAMKLDPDKWNRVKSLITRLGGGERDIDDILTPNDAEVARLRSAPKSTYAEIIALSDSIITEIRFPPRIGDSDGNLTRN